jgi:hypothetical protein
MKHILVFSFNPLKMLSVLLIPARSKFLIKLISLKFIAMEDKIQKDTQNTAIEIEKNGTQDSTNKASQPVEISNNLHILFG